MDDNKQIDEIAGMLDGKEPDEQESDKSSFTAEGVLGGKKVRITVEEIG